MPLCRLALLCLPLAVCGCAAPLVIGGSAGGAAVARDRRPVGTLVND